MVKRAALICLLGIFAPAVFAKPKSPVSCKAYFSMGENDALTGFQTELGMNEAQAKWWKKHSKKYPGICFTENPEGAGLKIPVGTPLYAIVWEEHMEVRHYEGSASSKTSGTVTEDDGNQAAYKGDTTTTGVPEATDVYVTEGTLYVWVDPSGSTPGKLVPITEIKEKPISAKGKALAASTLGYSLLFHHYSSSERMLEQALDIMAGKITVRPIIPHETPSATTPHK